MPHINFTEDGDEWPSATGLTHLLPQEWLLNWYKREVKKHGWRGWQKCEATAERGRRIGTHVHSLVEAMLKGDQYNTGEPPRRDLKIREMAILLFTNIDKSAILGLEEHLTSDELKIHGTADLICDNKIYDWKTSNGMDDKGFPLQLAIYAKCWNEKHPDQPIEWGEINRVDKKARKAYLQNKVYGPLTKYYPVIEALRVVWDYVNRQGSWKKDKGTNEC